MESRKDAKEALVELHHKLHRARLVPGSSGNASMIDQARSLAWIKRSGVRCGDVAEDDLVKVDATTGSPISTTQRPSVDTPVHLAVYRARPDVIAVVHTHSLYATLYSMRREPLPSLVTGTAEIFGQSLPCLPFELSREKLSTVLTKVALEAQAGCLLERHGVLAWGGSTLDALAAAEVLEWTAKLHFKAEQLGDIRPLDPELVDRHILWYKHVYSKS